MTGLTTFGVGAEWGGGRPSAITPVQGDLQVSRTRVFVASAALAVTASVLVPTTASAAVDSQVYTWGSNSFGQLGDGSSTSTVRGTPDLASISNIVDVSGGREHVIALTDSGTVFTWGLDAFGQLGDGLPLANKTSPVQVSSLQASSTSTTATTTRWP